VHLDVNKTLIAIDPASGQDVPTALEGALGKCCWGKLVPHSECQIRASVGGVGSVVMPDGQPAPRADCMGFAFLDESECAVAIDHGLGDTEGVRSLVEFLEEEMLPYATLVTAARDGFDPAEVRAANERVKELRREIMHLVFAPGGGGERFQPHLAAMHDALAVPEGLAPAFAASGLAHEPTGTVRFLVPAYFALLRWLSEERPGSTVVFRTFGTDLPEVIREHNAYCEGKHPLYPDAPRLDGSDGGQDFRVRCPQGTGAMLRFADGRDGTAMATVHVDDGGDAGPARIVVGTGAIHEVLESRRRSGMRAMGLRDHYGWWKSHDETGEAGKVLLVREDAASLRDELAVFFDDNIGNERAKIVDARNFVTGEALPFSTSRGLFLRKAAMPLVLEDELCFVRGVQDAEARADAIVRAAAAPADRS